MAFLPRWWRGSSGWRCDGQRIPRRPTPALGRPLQRLYGSVQLVSLRDQHEMFTIDIKQRGQLIE
jgi:hypothetical protein